MLTDIQGVDACGEEERSVSICSPANSHFLLIVPDISTKLDRIQQASERVRLALEASARGTRGEAMDPKGFGPSSNVFSPNPNSGVTEGNF